MSRATLATVSFTRSLHGFGLRVEHYTEILRRGVRADVCEALTENFMGRGGRPLAVLEMVRRDVALTLHGVSLSIGSVDPLDRAYLRELRSLCERFQPLLVSDHLCFASVDGQRAYDLWPLPRTQEAAAHVVERVTQVQAALGRQICLENVSSYVELRGNELSECDFLVEVANRADCMILLDVNNVYVSSRNQGFDASEYLARLPASRVAQIHLAGHKDCGDFLLDDHGRAIQTPVWELYREATRLFGAVPTIVEWDENLPALEALEREAQRAKEAARDAAR